MTVRELREVLFNLENQDIEIKMCIHDSGSVKHYSINKNIEEYTKGGYYLQPLEKSLYDQLWDQVQAKIED